MGERERGPYLTEEEFGKIMGSDEYKRPFVPKVKKINEYQDQSELIPDPDEIFNEMPSIEFESGEWPITSGDPVSFSFDINFQDADPGDWPPGC